MTFALNRALASALQSVGAPGFLILLAACEPAAADSLTRSADKRSARQPPSVVVDSFLPMSELIARFQSASGERTDSLSGDIDSADSLVRRYVDALAGGDTLSLRTLAVSRREYAYLVFPNSDMSHPPYELNPEVAWLLHRLESEKGITSALRVVQGLDATYAGFECLETETEQRVQSLRNCLVRLRRPDSTIVQARLFRDAILVGGKYKILSYANSLSASTVD